MSGITFQLYDAAGQRKYLTKEEREAFLSASEHADRQVRTLCMALTYTGCRISEALQLTADRADLSGKVIVFESLKKRRKGLYRAVPVPPGVLDALDLVHGLAVKTGACANRAKPIPIKRHGRKAVSLFAHGLAHLRKLFAAPHIHHATVLMKSILSNRMPPKPLLNAVFT